MFLHLGLDLMDMIYIELFLVFIKNLLELELSIEDIKSAFSRCKILKDKNLIENYIDKMEDVAPDLAYILLKGKLVEDVYFDKHAYEAEYMLSLDFTSNSISFSTDEKELISHEITNINNMNETDIPDFRTSEYDSNYNSDDEDEEVDNWYKSAEANKIFNYRSARDQAASPLEIYFIVEQILENEYFHNLVNTDKDMVILYNIINRADSRHYNSETNTFSKSISSSELISKNRALITDYKSLKKIVPDELEEIKEKYFEYLNTKYLDNIKYLTTIEKHILFIINPYINDTYFSNIKSKNKFEKLKFDILDYLTESLGAINEFNYKLRNDENVLNKIILKFDTLFSK